MLTLSWMPQVLCSTVSPHSVFAGFYLYVTKKSWDLGPFHDRHLVSISPRKGVLWSKAEKRDAVIEDEPSMPIIISVTVGPWVKLGSLWSLKDQLLGVLIQIRIGWEIMTTWSPYLERFVNILLKNKLELGCLSSRLTYQALSVNNGARPLASLRQEVIATTLRQAVEQEKLATPIPFSGPQIGAQWQNLPRPWNCPIKRGEPCKRMLYLWSQYQPVV